MHEIRWHGRGGQGAVTSSKILADAAFRSGFAGVTAAPTFGAERSGAPITASTRLDDQPIRVLLAGHDARRRRRAGRVAAGRRERDRGAQARRDHHREHAARARGPGHRGRRPRRHVRRHRRGRGRGPHRRRRARWCPPPSSAPSPGRRGSSTMESLEAAITSAFKATAARKNIEAARIAWECTPRAGRSSAVSSPSAPRRDLAVQARRRRGRRVPVTGAASARSSWRPSASRSRPARSRARSAGSTVPTPASRAASRPEFDLEHCKGCGICAEVCPSGAIVMMPEAEHGTCVLDEPVEAESTGGAPGAVAGAYSHSSSQLRQPDGPARLQWRLRSAQERLRRGREEDRGEQAGDDERRTGHREHPSRSPRRRSPRRR